MVTVDVEIFGTLDEAVRFVAERGGGIVYCPWANSIYIQSMKLPKGVQIKLPGERLKDERSFE